MTQAKTTQMLMSLEIKKFKIVCYNLYCLFDLNESKEFNTKKMYVLSNSKKKMKIYELKPITSQKSFYGKAYVLGDEKGNLFLKFSK